MANTQSSFNQQSSSLGYQYTSYVLLFYAHFLIEIIMFSLSLFQLMSVSQREWLYSAYSWIPIALCDEYMLNTPYILAALNSLQFVFSVEKAIRASSCVLWQCACDFPPSYSSDREFPWQHIFMLSFNFPFLSPKV